MNFGNAEAMVEMVRLTGVGVGFGKKLGMGSYRLAASYEHPEYSMTVKKQEMPAYDPRALQGIGLNYATGNRGGCHVRGYTTAVEVLGNPVKIDMTATVGKAQWVIIFQNLTAALDSTGMCLFCHLRHRRGRDRAAIERCYRRSLYDRRIHEGGRAQSLEP